MRSLEPEAATPSDVTPIPLQYSPMPATSHHYEMVDGVMHVYADEGSTNNLFEVSAAAAWMLLLVSKARPSVTVFL